MRVLLFLSFAADDSVIAEQVVEWLCQYEDIRICSRRGTRADDPLVSGSLEHKIAQSDAFLAIMSPSYLASPSCRRERVVALHREPPGAEDDPPTFIQAVKVRETQFLATGPFRTSHWVDMIEPGKDGTDTAVRKLHAKLTAIAATASPAETVPQHELPSFHNRDEEQEEVIDELTRSRGVHLWRLIAAPQLGKSWFVDRIGATLEERDSGNWTVKLVDVRDVPAEDRTNVGLLLGLLFGFPLPVATDRSGLEECARKVTSSDHPHVCLLDSAELLGTPTATELRICLSRIRERVTSIRKRGVWLAIVVASRTYKDWTGSGEVPALRLRKLSEFDRDVVAKALAETRARMPTFDPLPDDQLQQYAKRIHQLSEGLPALIYRYLDWIYVDNWVQVDRLLDDRPFYMLTQPYLEGLLSPGSLFGPGAISEDLRYCVRETLQVLVPYRLYTEAHISKQLEPGGELYQFASAENQKWDARKISDALRGTDLNDESQQELWDIIYPPLRRLLCRLWYPADATLAEAHAEAGRFLLAHSYKLQDRDRCTYLIECLWHKSQLLLLNRAIDATYELPRFAARLTSDLLADSAGYSTVRLRSWAADRMRADVELADAVAGLRVSYDELVGIVGGGQP